MGARQEQGWSVHSRRVKCRSVVQTFLERIKNAVFYYGTLMGEEWRALPV